MAREDCYSIVNDSLCVWDGYYTKEETAEIIRLRMQVRWKGSKWFVIKDTIEKRNERDFHGHERNEERLILLYGVQKESEVEKVTNLINLGKKITNAYWLDDVLIVESER